MKIRVTLCWDNFAKYHYDRVAALRPAVAAMGIKLSCVEMIQKSQSHLWSTDMKSDLRMHRLAKRAPVGFGELLVFIYNLWNAIYVTDCDVIFTPSYSPLRPALLMLIAKLKGRSIVMMNDSHANSARANGIKLRIKRAMINMCDAGFVAGSPHVRYYSAMGMPRRLLFVGYDAIDGASFRARSADVAFLQSCEAKFHFPIGAVLFVGRLIPEKNLGTLVRAYSILHVARGGDVPALVLVGEGKERDAIYAAAHNAQIPVLTYTYGASWRNVRGTICMYPFCANEEVAYFYRMAAVFVLPSRSETWGIVVSEAVACATPVLVSRLVGCAEDLVESGVNGLLFDPNNEAELAQRLDEILFDSNLRSALRRGASEKSQFVDIDSFVTGFIGSSMAAYRATHGSVVI